MGRLGDTVEDLAPSVIFMLTDGMQYTTGQTLDVCGGQSLHNNYREGMLVLEEHMASKKEE
jgi:hypothetical protein